MLEIACFFALDQVSERRGTPGGLSVSPLLTISLVAVGCAAGNLGREVFLKAASHESRLM
jgi:hypothetical protein